MQHLCSWLKDFDFGDMICIMYIYIYIHILLCHMLYRYTYHGWLTDELDVPDAGGFKQILGDGSCEDDVNGGIGEAKLDCAGRKPFKLT